MALDYRDFNEAAAAALQSINEEGIVDKPGGGRYVVYVGRIINKTTQNWETTQLTKSVTIELRRSGKVVVTLVPPGDDADRLQRQILLGPYDRGVRKGYLAPEKGESVCMRPF